MEVKCKKCRFKFQISDVSGGREFHCVCPRCGMPFIYRIEDDSVSGVELTDGDAEEKIAPMPVYVEKETLFELAGQDLPTHSFSSNRQKISSLSWLQTKDSGGRWQRWQRLLLVAVLMISVIIVYRFAIVREEGLLDKEVELLDNISSRSEEISKVSPMDTLRKRHLQSVPHWVQGSWILRTDDLLITTTINGQHIAERTDKGETYYGMFYYHDGQLICNFDDGTVSVYRLDSKQHRIIIDDMYMEKVDY